jgi:hypothetical protein
MKLVRTQDVNAAARRITCNAAYELAFLRFGVWRLPIAIPVATAIILRFVSGSSS